MSTPQSIKPPASTPTPLDLNGFFAALASLARASGAFGEITSERSRVHCTDPVQDAAAYRVAFEDGAVWVAWVSADRYLSQSIESEVRWTGDDINELVEEETVEQGVPAADKPGNFEHFRSEEKLFTFRSRLPLTPQACAQHPEGTAAIALKYLRGYQAAFRNLGDMKAGDE